MSATRDMRALVAKLVKLGIEVTYTKAGHWRVVTPKGLYFMPSTPSDTRGLRNTKAALRQRGIEV